MLEENQNNSLIQDGSNEPTPVEEDHEEDMSWEMNSIPNKFRNYMMLVDLEEKFGFQNTPAYSGISIPRGQKLSVSVWTVLVHGVWATLLLEPIFSSGTTLRITPEDVLDKDERIEAQPKKNGKETEVVQPEVQHNFVDLDDY
uniref:Uncharacterized protein n=1 Tax=Cannabis sativa TaxID=3483 RepID=A0A803PNH0_CANSA